MRNPWKHNNLRVSLKTIAARLYDVEINDVSHSNWLLTDSMIKRKRVEPTQIEELALGKTWSFPQN